MKQLTDLEYLRLSKGKRLLHRLGSFFASIPHGIVNGLASMGRGIKKAAVGLGNDVADIISTFKNGDWAAKASFLVMGTGNMAHGQWLRGLLSCSLKSYSSSI